MCARHPRGFRRLARFVRRVSEVLPELRDPVYAHRLFACRTRIMAESPCQGKSDSTYGLINSMDGIVRLTGFGRRQQPGRLWRDETAAQSAPSPPLLGRADQPCGLALPRL